MFKRKLLAFICTIIISAPIVGICFMLIEESTIKEIPGLIFTYIIAIPVTLIYGIPISMLSDILNNQVRGKRREFFSLIVHLFFGICLIMVLDSRFYLTEFNMFDLYFLVASTIISFIFWAVDEILRKYYFNIRAD
ncbi:hypothetical protein ACFQ88_05365 [Paenibacillus sp. NPDC056579]|uniref:hypothetical protein n=1 Tax=unclassified Paenibacillus TaxID=185978 RepID=UPI001EF84D76|nr:hypothetical protein [Paenibacillus sp. H1-7]ULL16416.1 hypothetical protein DVH26_19400 [Paenibacillus sp. H1-7]